MSDSDKPLERTDRSRMHLRRKKDSGTFGHFAESTARFMGSPKFILYITVFVATWVATNVVLVKPVGQSWDPYPLILLNLASSTQASYLAPLTLLARNRQDDRDRVMTERGWQRTERNLTNTEHLTREIAGLRMSMGDVATCDFVRSELCVTLEESDRDREGRLAERDQRIAELQVEFGELKAEHEES